MFCRTLNSKKQEDNSGCICAKLVHAPSLGLGVAAGDYPPINVYRSPDKALIIAQLPGVTAGDINIDVFENMLTIKGTPARESFESLKAQKQERFFEQFFRSIQLPFAIDADSAIATISKGVLRIELARPKKTETIRKIEIKKHN